MSNYHFVWQLLFEFTMVVVLVFGAVGFAAGIGLIVSSARTFRFFHVMNRWISIRRALRPIEIPRDADQFAHKYRRWVGVFLIAGGIFSAFGLAAKVKASSIGAMLAKGAVVPLVIIVVETLRWFLIAGSVTGVVIGFLFCYSPSTLISIGRYANKWFSPRRLTRGVDEMHLTLDKLVEAHPKLSGAILTCTALGVAVYSRFLLFIHS